MAHTLTFDYSVYCQVNGVAKDSPYTLSNGDVITVTPNYESFIVNGTTYDSSVANTISISNSDITITTNSSIPTPSGPNSTINYTEASTPRLSVDVSTLAGWANLSTGEKSITIVAKAAGFKDSAPSTAVQVTKAASTKTLAAGSYKWADSLTLQAFDVGIEFKSNNLNWNRFTISPTEGGYINYIGNQGEDIAYNTSAGWLESAYQTITLATDQQVSADFYEWAITGGNLVKQAAGSTWVLNEALTLSDSNGFTGIDFISNSTEYDYIGWYTDSETNNITMYYLRKSDNYQQKVYVRVRTPGSTGGWINGEAYRTLTFTTAPSGDLLTWLQSNATKQS